MFQRRKGKSFESLLPLHSDPIYSYNPSQNHLPSIFSMQTNLKYFLLLLLVLSIFFNFMLFFTPKSPVIYNFPTPQYTAQCLPDDLPYSFHIHIFTYNRIEGVVRLWNSLLSAHYSNYPIDITIHCDAGDTQAHRDIIQLVSSFDFQSSWPLGKVRINNRFINAGLKASILEAWFPTENEQQEFAFFFEDDITVSKYFFQYALQSIDKYYSDSISEEFLGIALYSPRYNQILNSNFDFDETGLYLLQLPCSWGQLFFPKSWRYFIQWLDMNIQNNPNFDPLVPNSHSNSWPIRASWKKYLIALMWEKGWYMLYPKLGYHLSFSTNHLDPGTNEKGPPSQILVNRFVVPLLEPNHLKTYETIPGLERNSTQAEIFVSRLDFESLPIFNIYHQRVSKLPDLVHCVSP